MKDKTPPKDNWLIVWRESTEGYTVCKYVKGEWFAQSGWYHDIGFKDEWMLLPARFK